MYIKPPATIGVTSDAANRFPTLRGRTPSAAACVVALSGGVLLCCTPGGTLCAPLGVLPCCALGDGAILSFGAPGTPGRCVAPGGPPNREFGRNSGALAGFMW